MSNRSISCNIRRILDIIDYCDDILTAIISIDFEKCFDRIETSSLLAAMDYFCSGESFQ